MSGAFDHLSEVEAAIVSAAVMAFVRELRRDGHRMPQSLLHRVESARRGQESTARRVRVDDDLRMYDIPATADVLDVSERTVARLIASGQLGSVLVGRSRRIPAEALRAYIAGLPSSFRDRLHHKTVVPVAPASRPADRHRRREVAV